MSSLAVTPASRKCGMICGRLILLSPKRAQTTLHLRAGTVNGRSFYLTATSAAHGFGGISTCVAGPPSRMMSTSAVSYVASSGPAVGPSQPSGVRSISSGSPVFPSQGQKASFEQPRRNIKMNRVRGRLAALASNPSDWIGLESAVVAPHHAVKILFSDRSVAEFKFIWLRSNCKCSSCVHESTGQRLLDAHGLDLNQRPKDLFINGKGQLEILWKEGDAEHRTTFDPSWLYKYGQCFMENTYESQDVERNRPAKEFWDRDKIWSNFPEVTYEEYQGSDTGLRKWLDYINRFGVAVIHGVPTDNPEQIREIVNRFAYVKQTAYGMTFDVIAEPKAAHLANTGRYLEHHTDLNYREKAPGLQLLHCLKSEVVGEGSEECDDAGGRSFFVDGFHVAQWLEDNEPAAFHILSSTPIRFQIKMDGKRYSQLWPIITLDSQGDIAEIHYNPRTSGPLQDPNNFVIPYFHALKKFVDKLRDPKSELVFSLAPGDVVAFDNRRVLHGRTAFDPTKVSRHLKGCYVDIDEALSKYDALL